MSDSGKISRGVLIPLGILVVAGIMGDLIGRGVALLVPGGLVHDLLISGFRLGMDPPWTLDLGVISIQLGFTLNLTFLGTLMILFFLFLYKKV